MRTIGIAIPTYERAALTFSAFENVYDDERIEHVHLNDDCSSMECFIDLSQKAKGYSKISVGRNGSNVDCYQNKMRSVWLSPMEWVILLDSDNSIDIPNYIDPLFSIEKWEPDTIYTPEFAAPLFDFRAYSELVLTKENVAEWIDRPMLETMLNAANYFVNKDEYIRVWHTGEKVDPVTSDSIFVAYKWLAAGNKIKVVKGLQYYHRVWEGSHYRKNVNRTPRGFHESILQKLRELK